MVDNKAICAWCYYARMRQDICGIYCTGGFTNEDGSCNHFEDYDEVKAQKRRAARERAAQKKAAIRQAG